MVGGLYQCRIKINLFIIHKGNDIGIFNNEKERIKDKKNNKRVNEVKDSLEFGRGLKD